MHHIEILETREYNFWEDDISFAWENGVIFHDTLEFVAGKVVDVAWVIWDIFVSTKI